MTKHCKNDPQLTMVMSTREMGALAVLVSHTDFTKVEAQLDKILVAPEYGCSVQQRRNYLGALRKIQLKILHTAQEMQNDERRDCDCPACRGEVAVVAASTTDAVH